MKKLISVVLVLAMVLSLSAVAFAADATYYVAGTMNEWDVSGTEMELVDGVYSATFALAKGTHEFKITLGDWNKENWGDNGQNYKFAVSSDCDVTITFNPDTKEIGVTGSGVVEAKMEINYVTAVGAGKDGFLNDANWNPTDASNKMTEVDGVYSIAYEGIPAGTYTYKFAANGAWIDDWGTGGVTESGVTYDAIYKGGDTQVIVDVDGSTVELVLDLSAMDSKGNGAKITATVTAPSDGGDEGDETEPVTYYLTEGVTQSITIPAGGSANVVVDATASNMILKVDGKRAYWDWWFQAGMLPSYPNPGGFAEAQVPMGGIYTVTIHNGNTEAEQVLDVTATADAPSFGTWDNPAELVIGENVAEVGAGGNAYFFNWIATEDGELTVAINTAVSFDWALTCNVHGESGSSYGDTHYSDDETIISSETVKVSAGDKVEIIVGSASFGDATVVLDVSFVPGEVGGETGGEEGGETGGEEGGEKEECVLSDTQLVVGENTLTLNPDADFTVFEFCPDEIGVYKFTVNNAEALVGYSGGSSFYFFAPYGDLTNSFEQELANVGPSIMVGISNVEGEFVLTVEKVGDADIKEIVWVDYENVELEDFSDFEFDGEVIALDVTDPELSDKIFIGSDGLFRYGSENGPIIVSMINDNAYIDFANLLNNGAMRVPEFDEAGDLIGGYDFSNAMAEYIEAGNVPMTLELMLMIAAYGSNQGWFDQDVPGFYLFDEEVDPEIAFLCFFGYAEGTEITEPETPEDPEVVPGTGDYSVAGLVVAMMAATAGAVVIGKKKEF